MTFMGLIFWRRHCAVLYMPSKIPLKNVSIDLHAHLQLNSYTTSIQHNDCQATIGRSEECSVA